MAEEAKAPYSLLDRTLHKLAFGSAALQDMLNDIEQSRYAKEWQAIQPEAPLFVTSLPRAGTTIVLEALHRLSAVATHTYRDMPFIATPVAWERLAGRFRQQGVSKERAHGDGLIISEDSPEAFEEVLWQRYFPGQFHQDGIALLSEGNEKFRDFFAEHMRKIILLRRPGETAGVRYISKNNGNISRVAAIRDMFPAAVILVPLRDPLEHAISLWRQHLNFTAQHGQDDFIRRYMADLGHFEFGSLHRPIRFPGMENDQLQWSPEQAEYWLYYWLCAFRHLSTQSGLKFVAYEALCAGGRERFAKLLDGVGIKASAEQVSSAAGVFRAAPPARAKQQELDASLVESAKELHQVLLSKSI